MAATESEARLIARLASRHAISEDAIRAVLRALKASGGAMAQFSHPEFGGMSQWSGGMTMIGDMCNEGLKAKLDAIAASCLPTSEWTPHPARARLTVVLRRTANAPRGGPPNSARRARSAGKTAFATPFSRIGGVS